MNCPVCPDTQLQMTERQGVEIDYCPKCRGVWLDRGELDKIIDRASVDMPTAAPQPSAPPPPPQTPQPNQPQQPPYGPPPIYGNQHQQQPYRQKDDSDYKFRYPQQGGYYPKKKKSILSDIFDF